MLTEDGTSRCQAHKPKAWAHGRHESRHARGYGSAWDRLRLQILKRDGYRCRCAECVRSGALLVAHEVDHVIGKAEWLRRRGSLDGVDDPSNLSAINRECHARKTQREIRGGR